MNPSPLLQTIGNICAGLAALVVVIPLPRLLSNYASKHLSNDSWVTPSLLILIPLWLLLMGALLCMTASGGFDSLRFGRPALYTLTVAAPLALAVVTFVFVGLYIRPGFTPSGLYAPVIYLVPLATALLVVASLNQKLAPGIPIQWLRLPWTIFAALSLVVCVAVSGYWLFRTGMGGVAGIAHRIANPGPTSQETLAQVSALNPETDFESLLWRASGSVNRKVREAATARLRSHPNFLERMAAELEDGHVEPAVAFLRDAELTPAEQARFARPARTAMQRWVDRIPAPNFTTKKHLKDLRRWGMDFFPALTNKFASSGVDFAPVMADFKDKVEPR